MKYILKVNKTDNAYYCDCNEVIDENGNVRLLHNEIGFSFIIVDGKMKQLGGWHIGTEDFDFNEMEDWVIEHYHPGLTEQLMSTMEEWL